MSMRCRGIDYVIIISHLDELKNQSDYILEIIKKNISNTNNYNHSYVNNNTNILNNPSDYIGRIVKFTIDNYNNPLIVPLIQLGQANVNLTEYQFSMGYNGTYTTPRNVLFRPNNLSPIPKPPLVEQDLSSTYYFIYQYIEMLILFNATLQSALDDLVAIFPALSATPYPIFTYNYQTGIVFTVSNDFQQDYGTNYTATKIQILINQQLSPLFNGFSFMQLQTPNSCKLSFLMDPTVMAITDGHYIFGNQSLQELCYWSSIVSYEISTNMPIVAEISPSPIGANNQLPSQVNTILTDLSPDVTNNVSYHTVQIYNNIDNLRVFNLISTTPMSSYNGSVYILDAYGRRIPLYLQYGQTVYIKYQFIKKSIYKGLK